MSDKKKTVTCKVCGAPMRAEHGIIHPNEQTGVTWWQCINPDCKRRVKELYRIENNMIVTVSSMEV